MKSTRSWSMFVILLANASVCFAETRTVQVSGSVDSKWIYKKNMDLRDGNDTSIVPLTGTVPGVPGSGSSVTDSGDAADWFMSIVQLQVSAGLTENVSTVINLFNQRDWNSNLYDGGTTAASTPVGTNEFDLGIDQAYVTLEKIFYEPLTLTLGRQDLLFGRGFVLGSADYADPQSAIAADEFAGSNSFDAAKATLDFDSWTLDGIWARFSQGDANDRDGHDLYWLNVNHQFAEYEAVWEGYLGADVDDATADNAAAVSDSVRPHRNTTYVIGTRAQFDPVKNMTLGGEAVYQWGDFSASATAPQFGLDRDAWGLDFFGEYHWTEHAYKPFVGIEYILFSGDDLNTSGTYEGWNTLNRDPAYGAIHEYVEAYYQTALIGDDPGYLNLRTFFITAGFEPMEDLRLDGQFFWFWTDQDINNTTHGGSQMLGGDLGTEMDLNVTYGYTEDVTFTLGAAWFFPGGIYEEALTDSAAGATGQGAVDAVATQVVAGVSVGF